MIRMDIRCLECDELLSSYSQDLQVLEGNMKESLEEMRKHLDIECEYPGLAKEGS